MQQYIHVTQCKCSKVTEVTERAAGYTVSLHHCSHWNKSLTVKYTHKCDCLTFPLSVHILDARCLCVTVCTPTVLHPVSLHQPQPQGVPGVPEQGAPAGAEVPRRTQRLSAVAGQRQNQHSQMFRRASKCSRGLHRSAEDPGMRCLLPPAVELFFF